MEIKFRGIRNDGIGWVHGDVIHGKELVYIATPLWIEVIPETIGQFVGVRTTGIDEDIELYVGDKHKDGYVLQYDQQYGVYEWIDSELLTYAFTDIYIERKSDITTIHDDLLKK